jgi:hypothetical protein
MKSRKSKPQHAARKKAFDDVLATYRQAQDMTGGIGAIVIGDGGKGVSNPVRPSLTDFRCDVERVFGKCLKGSLAWKNFFLAYVLYDSDDVIDMGMHAQKILGDGMHGLEQGMGALFIKHGIYPLHGKGGYFHCIRQPRGDV